MLKKTKQTGYNSKSSNACGGNTGVAGKRNVRGMTTLSEARERVNDKGSVGKRSRRDAVGVVHRLSSLSLEPGHTLRCSLSG